MCLEFISLIYMYTEDLVLDNLQPLIYHKTKPNQTEPIQILNSVLDWASK